MHPPGSIHEGGAGSVVVNMFTNELLAIHSVTEAVLSTFTYDLTSAPDPQLFGVHPFNVNVRYWVCGVLRLS